MTKVLIAGSKGVIGSWLTKLLLKEKYRSKFCYCGLHGLPIVVYRGHSRTSLYLQEACQTLANLVSNFKDGEIYNIGGKKEYKMEKWISDKKSVGKAGHQENFSRQEFPLFLTLVCRKK